jgi:predicted DNA-binding transcriptional regulator AlpA
MQNATHNRSPHDARRSTRDATILFALPEDAPITLDEAAIVANCSRRHLMQRRADGEGPKTYRLGDRCVRTTRADVLAWVRTHAEGGIGA